MAQKFFNRTPGEIKFEEKLVLGQTAYHITDVIWEESGQKWKIVYGNYDSVLYAKDTDQLTVVVES